MWQPLRIDHHGWQLALLAWAMASLTDPKRARGGVDARPRDRLLAGRSAWRCCPISRSAGAIVVLMWVRDAGEARRLAAYGVSLGGGCAFGFLVFTSEANMAPLCDALTPVWLSAMLARRRDRGGARLADARNGRWRRLGARRRRRRDARRRLRLGRAAMPRPARTGPARARAAVALQGARGDADLAARLRHRRPDADPAGRRPDRLCADALARAGATPREAHRLGGDRACSPRSPPALLCGRPAPGPPRSCSSIPGATALAWVAIVWLMGRRHDAGARVRRRRRLPRSSPGSPAARLTRDLNATPLSEGRKAINRANNRCPTLCALAPDRPPAARHGADLRRSRPAADHGHPPRRDHRPLSPQRRADPRRDARLARRRGQRAAHGRSATMSIIC